MNPLRILAAGTVAALACHAAQVSSVTRFLGMCDASGAVGITSNLFVICDDEDNRLRIYDVDRGGLPVRTFDPSAFLRVDPREPEVDLEGAARLGNRIYWITSHGRNKNAKYRESRLRLFATDIAQHATGPTLNPTGRYYSHLLADVLADRRLRRFHLDASAQLPPKARGGFNIEGLTATPDGKLMFGFRNPIPEGRALLVPILNPEQIIAGKVAKLGDPILLNLHGRGIRAIALHQKRYVIIAGSFDGSLHPRLYFWAGDDTEPERVDANLGSLNPEALAVYPGRPGFQILSDDGTQLVDGIPCKDCKDKNLKSFRGLFILP